MGLLVVKQNDYGGTFIAPIIHSDPFLLISWYPRIANRLLFNAKTVCDHLTSAAAPPTCYPAY